MRYTIPHHQLRSFYSEHYLQKRPSQSFSVSRDEIDTGCLHLSLQEWKTPLFQAHLLNSSCTQNTVIDGALDHDMVILYFTCAGNSQILRSTPGNIEIPANNHAVFYPHSHSPQRFFPKGDQHTFFKIFLPTKQVAWLDQILETASTSRKTEQSTTLEMKSILNQMMRSQFMGRLASVYFEAKIQELLVLQFHQLTTEKKHEEFLSSSYRQALHQVREYIEKNYQNPPTIAHLSRIAGMSTTLLKKTFKLCFKTTIHSYASSYRMQMAQNLLSSQTANIAEIAYQTGFEHPSHFTTAFKRQYGITPQQYRSGISCRQVDQEHF